MLVEIIEKNAFLFLEFPSKIGHISRELSSAHSENSEIDRLNCFFEFFAFKIQFPHILTTYNVGTTLWNSFWSLSKMRVSSTQIMTSSRSSSYRKAFKPIYTKWFKPVYTKVFLPRAAQLGELSTTAGYSWKLSMSAYLQNFATKNAVFTHSCVKNLWFHRYVTICLTRASIDRPDFLSIDQIFYR